MSKSKTTYVNLEGKKVVIPSIVDGKTKIFPYIHVCLKRKHPDISVAQVERVWEKRMEKNKLIVQYLQALADEERTKGDKWRASAYTRAIRIIKNLKVPISNGKQAQRFKGIGVKIGGKIDEITKTGQLQRIDQKTQEAIKKQQIVESFIDVWGIGVVKANNLYNQGFRTIESLGGAKLNNQQRIGVKYYNDIKLRIPHNEVTELGKVVERGLKLVDPQAKVVIGGSYRRNEPTSGDIDLVVTSPLGEKSKIAMVHQNKQGKIIVEYLTKLVEQLHKIGFLTDDLSLGKNKYMGIAHLENYPHYRRIDILYIPPEEWGSGVLHFTGPKAFNIDLRRRAIELGYKLNEKGLFKKDGSRIETPTEESIFEKLGVEYIEPPFRK